MLVLTRKPGEKIVIGDDIVITILESRGEGVRIGLDAPRGIRIHRAEVLQAVSEANAAAAKTAESAPEDEARIRAALGLTPPKSTPPAAPAG